MFLFSVMIFGANSVSAQGSSVDLSAPGDYINLGTALTNATNFTTSSVFTMETWVKINTVAGYNTIFANRPSGGSERGYAFFLYDGKPYFESYASGSIAPTAIDANVWTHVALVFNYGTCSFYINGEFVHSSSGVNVYPRSSTSALLGTLTNGWAGFNGSLDEFRIWNVARTQEEIAADMSHNTLCNDNGLLAYFPFDENSGTAVSSTIGGYVGELLSGAAWSNGVSVSPCPPPAPLQTLTILGGNGQPGDIDPYIEASRDNGATWQPAFLTGWHPWNFVDGTNSWINFDPSPFVGLYEETDYRIRFYIPEEFSDPKMTFTIKADNYAWLSINGRVLDYITGQASNAPDLSIDQDLVPGLNEITVRLKDEGGWVGLNYRIDITMYSNEAPTFEPSRFVNTAPVANAGQDQTIDCAPLAGSEVTLDGSGSSDEDGDVLSYSWSNGATTAAQTVTLAPGTHTLILIVNDGKGGTASDEVTVTINADATAPVPDAEALADVTGECGAVVTEVPTATDECEGPIVGTTSDPLEYTSQGAFVVTWTFTDSNGNFSEQTQNVVVDDVTEPTIESTEQALTLWSPNHKYETVSLSDFGVSVTDNCADVSVSSILITKVTSDEPEDANSNGDGNTKNDIVIADDFQSVDLRKEREGTGNGRVYTIYVSVSDGNGNIGSASFQVGVPHDKKDTAIDDGAVYEVLGGTVIPAVAPLTNDMVNVGGGSSETDFSLQKNSDNEALPEGFELSQNYPNPFNPTTSIRFALPESGYYSLSVYNTLGQEVANLIDGQLSAGSHTVNFDASNLSSGIYIYSIRGANVNISKKMNLMK